MHSVDAQTDLVAIDLTPMIDVIFILVIFWMTVTQLSDSSSQPPLEIPSAGDNPTAATPAKLMTVNLLEDGSAVLVGEERTDLDGLAALLEASPPPEHVLVRADARANCLDLARLTQVLRDAGIERIGLAAREDRP